MHRLHDVWQFSETSLKHRIVNKTDIAHPQRWVSPIFRTPQQQVHPPGIRTFSSTSTGTSISTTLEENNGQSGAAVHSPLYNKTSWCGSVPLITVIIILSKFNPIFCSVLPHKSDPKPTRGLIVPGKCKKLDNNPNIAKGTTAPRVEWFLHKSWSNPSSES